MSTEQVNTTGSDRHRRPHERPAAQVRARRSRVGRVGALSIAVAYGGGFWLQLIHDVEGATEHGEPGRLVHWIRDSTLALPVVIIAVMLGLAVTDRLLHSAHRMKESRQATWATAAAVALSTSLALALASPFHAMLFQSHHRSGAEGGDMPAVMHMYYEFVVVLVANLLIASAVLIKASIVFGCTPIKNSDRYVTSASEVADIKFATACTHGMSHS